MSKCFDCFCFSCITSAAGFGNHAINCTSSFLGNFRCKIMSKSWNFLLICFRITSGAMLALLTVSCAGSFHIYSVVFCEIMTKCRNLFCNNIVTSATGFGKSSFFSTGRCYCCFHIIMSESLYLLNIIFRFAAFPCTMLALLAILCTSCWFIHGILIRIAVT